MRKSIFDIVKSNTDPASDALRLDSMFREEKTLEILCIKRYYKATKTI